MGILRLPSRRFPGRTGSYATSSLSTVVPAKLLRTTVPGQLDRRRCGPVSNTGSYTVPGWLVVVVVVNGGQVRVDGAELKRTNAQPQLATKFERQADGGTPGGQGVAGSNPVSPTNRHHLVGASQARFACWWSSPRLLAAGVWPPHA